MKPSTWAPQTWGAGRERREGRASECGDGRPLFVCLTLPQHQLYLFHASCSPLHLLEHMSSVPPASLVSRRHAYAPWMAREEVELASATSADASLFAAPPRRPSTFAPTSNAAMAMPMSPMSDPLAPPIAARIS